MLDRILNKMTNVQPAAARCILQRMVTSCQSAPTCFLQGVGTFRYYVDRDTGEICTSQERVKCGC